MSTLRPIHRLSVVLLFLLSCVTVVSPSFAQAPPESLKNAARGKFEFGVGISDSIGSRPQDWELLKKHFSIITPENCMKPQAVQPAPEEIKLADADRIVKFAGENGLRVVGHCLVWAKDDRTPPWFFKEGEQDAGRDVLLERMRTFIRAQVGRYHGKIAMWDVVNEALDDGDQQLRPSGWSRICGPDFLSEAFRCAHQADPDALLIYNDYNNELPKKRDKMLRLIESLLEQKVPLGAIGLQGHYELDAVPFEEIETTIATVQKLGLKVVVSELDIDVVPRSKWWAENGKYREELAKHDPYRDGCPPEILQRQAEQYGKLFSIFRKYAGTVVRVSFWNLHDGQSWLNYFPWRRENHPLLFDRQQREKPAFHAVMQALRAE